MKPQARTRTWHVAADGPAFAVFDPEGRFRVRFPTRAQADAYIADRSAARARNARRQEEFSEQAH